MARTVYWYNNSGSAKATDVNAGGNYTYWFQDAAHTTKVTVASGLPGAAGDTIHCDAGYLDCPAAGIVWSGVIVASGPVLAVDTSGNGRIFLINTNSVIASGIVFAGTTNALQDCSLTFTDVIFQGDLDLTLGFEVVTLTAAKWKVNNGTAGGNIVLAASSTIVMNHPHPDQILIFNDITIVGAGALVLIMSDMPEFYLTGDFTQTDVSTYLPGGTIFLLSNRASANGVEADVSGTGHVIGG